MLGKHAEAALAGYLAELYQSYCPGPVAGSCRRPGLGTYIIIPYVEGIPRLRGSGEVRASPQAPGGAEGAGGALAVACLLYTSPSPRDRSLS
eukprot:1824124-Pyramimonas_sp.AAC.1